MYTFQSRVRYSEVTKEQTLDLYAILNYFQDCSNFQSADLGVGVQYLTERSRAWLLSAWQVEIKHLPRLFDPITIGTWPYDFKGIYGYRNFILYNEAHGHEIAACANSIWFLVDTKNGKPLRITDEDSAPYALEPAYPMEYAPRKIVLPEYRKSCQNLPVPGTHITTPKDQTTPDAQTQPTACSLPPVTVTKMFLDTNNHVNNSQYVRIAQACLAEEFLPGSSQICRMRAEYRRAAVLNDIIYPSLLSCDNPRRCYVNLNDADGNAYAIVEFTTK